MRLHLKYRPRTMGDVIGQDTADLIDFAADPYPTCWAIEGPTGVGKTSTALALARQLGAWDDPLSCGPHVLSGAEFNVAALNHYFGPETPFRFRRRGWHVLMIEELEHVHPAVRSTGNDRLERTVKRYKLVVIATSNDLTKLPPAFRDRFQLVWFSGGPEFALAHADRLAEIWEVESGGRPLPPDWEKWGWGGENGDTIQYSARRALDRMQRELRRPSSNGNGEGTFSAFALAGNEEKI